jgi:hypothetical protein
VDVSDFVNYGTIISWVVGGVVFVIRLAKDETVIPRWAGTAVIGVVIVLGVLGSSIQTYMYYRHRKVIEKSVDRIVEKPVEKIIKADCPKVKERQPRSIVIPPGARIEGNANAPNSMAAGINTGNMIQGDVPPQFSQSISRENTPIQNDLYETTFDVQVNTNHTFVMQLKARGTYLFGMLKVDKKVPSGSGGVSIVILDERVSPTEGTASLQNVSSGTYFITVQTTKPDKVRLEISS